MNPDEIIQLIGGKEDEHCEFKEAKVSFNRDRLLGYCAALANEGGGRLVLGVTDQRPRQVVGTSAFANLDEIKHFLLCELRLRVDAQEVQIDNRRVVIFVVPSRPDGEPDRYQRQLPNAQR